MPLTISNTTGDGALDPYIDSAIELPDTGTSVTVTGTVRPAGGVSAVLNGSPLTSPAPPASGLVYWLIEANLTTGALTVLQSASAMPAVDTGCVLLFQQTLSPGATDAALVPTDVTPDTY